MICVPLMLFPKPIIVYCKSKDGEDHEDHEVCNINIYFIKILLYIIFLIKILGKSFFW